MTNSSQILCNRNRNDVYHIYLTEYLKCILIILLECTLMFTYARRAHRVNNKMLFTMASIDCKTSGSVCKKQYAAHVAHRSVSHTEYDIYINSVWAKLGQHDASGPCIPCKSYQMGKPFDVNHLPMCQLIVFDFPLRMIRIWFSLHSVTYRALDRCDRERKCPIECTYTPSAGHNAKDANWIFLFLAASKLLTSCSPHSFAYNLFYVIGFFFPSFVCLIYWTQRKTDTNHLHWGTDQ